MGSAASATTLAPGSVGFAIGPYTIGSNLSIGDKSRMSEPLKSYKRVSLTKFEVALFHIQGVARDFHDLKNGIKDMRFSSRTNTSTEGAFGEGGTAKQLNVYPDLDVSKPHHAELRLGSYNVDVKHSISRRSGSIAGHKKPSPATVFVFTWGLIPKRGPSTIYIAGWLPSGRACCDENRRDNVWQNPNAKATFYWEVNHEDLEHISTLKSWVRAQMTFGAVGVTK